MFSPPKKQLDHELKIKRNGKKLSIQLIQGNIGDFISMNTRFGNTINNVAMELNKLNAMLSKLGPFTDRKTLKSDDRAMFNLCLSYALFRAEFIIS